MEERKSRSPHRITLERRQTALLTGIAEVNSFDEKEIRLMTTEGGLQIKGEGLHVKQLDLEQGNVEIEGKIDSLIYQQKGMREKEALLKRMFR